MVAGNAECRERGGIVLFFGIVVNRSSAACVVEMSSVCSDGVWCDNCQVRLL